jgi:hypothetical protein
MVQKIYVDLMALRPQRAPDLPAVILPGAATQLPVVALPVRLVKQPVWWMRQVASLAELPVDLRLPPVVRGFRNSDPGPMSALVLRSQQA